MIYKTILKAIAFNTTWYFLYKRDKKKEPLVFFRAQDQGFVCVTTAKKKGRDSTGGRKLKARKDTHRQNS